MKQFIFLGPCDRLRMAGGEEHWQQMMLEKAPISIDQFARDRDLLTLLEDDETLEDFIASDPESGFYTSIWGDQPCRFIQTCGFEFVFTPPVSKRFHRRSNPYLLY